MHIYLNANWRRIFHKYCNRFLLYNPEFEYVASYTTTIYFTSSEDRRHRGP
jgi:hypothetical protein